MPRLQRVLMVAAAMWLVAPSPAAGQPPTDSTRLVRAIAAFVVNELLPAYRSELEVLIVEPTERLEGMVARELATLPPFRRPVRDSAQAVRIRVSASPEYPWLPAGLRGLPAVLVTTTACKRSEDWGGGHGWRSQELYVFKPAGEGWEVAGGMTIDNADGSCRPGPKPDPPRRPGD